MDEQTTLGQADDSGCVDLERWPDALIRAVAAEAPELFRIGDTFACRTGDIEAYARSLATVSLEEDDLEYLDVAGYAAALAQEPFFRRFDADGDEWLVATGQGSSRWLDGLPRDFSSLSREQWPDDLIAAVGAQAPHMLRLVHGDVWAVAEAEFDRFADYWLLEGFCDAQLYPFIDRARFAADQRRRFTPIDVAGETWHVKVDDEEPLATPRQANERGGLSVLEWPDSLIGAVAGEQPTAFRVVDYETLFAVPDEHLVAVLTQWAEGRDDEVASAGGLEPWTAQVRDEEMRAVSVAGRRWWVYAHEWPIATQTAEASAPG